MVEALLTVAAALIFSVYDYALFPLTDNPDGSPNAWRIPYRISQIVLQLALYTACFFLAGWTCAAAAALVWWTGGCDVLYYLYDGPRSSFWGERRWFWMWWTPLGLARRAQGRRDPLMSSTEVLWQALIGAVLSVPFLFL